MVAFIFDILLCVFALCLYISFNNPVTFDGVNSLFLYKDMAMETFCYEDDSFYCIVLFH